jgi:catechol 2,3-dioxygenase-like lactoylglutathione lyase family enzyme
VVFSKHEGELVFSDFAATLPVSDMERAVAFYREVLGLEPVEQGEGPTQYSVGGSNFVLYESEFAGTNRATAATFVAGDVKSAVATLRGRGVEFDDVELEGATTEDGITTMPDGSAGAWFKDSEGNILGIFEFPEA